MLSSKLAQRIVEKVMETIPHNINIMNEKGIIIGSGDLERIGKVHSGAVETIRTEQAVEILNDTLEDKAGVNIPIIFRKKVVGVIGITGSPEIVRPFGKLVSITAELLVSQEYTLNEHIIEQKLLEEYIYQWINMSDNYDENFIQKGLSLGIDVTCHRIGVIIQATKESYKNIRDLVKKFINENEHILNISYDRVIILMNFDKYTNRRITSLEEKLREINVKAGVGNFHEKIMISLKEGTRALEIGSRLYEKQNIYKYEDMKFFDGMSGIFENGTSKEIMYKILEEGGEDLFKTFLKYVELNGERSIIAKDLHIHRNTLNYRMDKIQEITNLDLNNYKHLIQIITAYIYYKLNL